VTDSQAESIGVNVLTLYAQALGKNAPTFRAEFRAKYGVETIIVFGKMANGLNFNKIRDEFEEAVAEGKTNPTPATINTILVKLGGTPPTVLEAAADVASEIGGYINLGGKLFLVGAALYFLISSGVLVGLIRGAKEIRRA